MKSIIAVRLLFVVAALYDGILGLAFLFGAEAVFERFNVPPPNHFGYVHFPACLLVVFGIMFLTIAAAPVRNRNLILYGVLLKVSYCSVVFYHWTTAGIPGMWKPFAFCDLLFIALFVAAFFRLFQEPK
ncbi:MAG: hypothetical protein ACC628_25530 [Pirellulaceae bacterium]